jgi:D-alanine--(R)-lactate ligase
VPAPIPEAARALAVETAMTVYRALGCRGLARVDMFLTQDGQVVLNEVNTMPGFTSYSRFPRMMASAGVPMNKVIDRLIALALEKEAQGRETDI